MKGFKSTLTIFGDPESQPKIKKDFKHAINSVCEFSALKISIYHYINK